MESVKELTKKNDGMILISTRMTPAMLKELKIICAENDITMQRMISLALRRQIAMVRFDANFLKEQDADERD